MADDPQNNQPVDNSLALQKYQIIAQVILGTVGVAGYMAILSIVVLRNSPWTAFQENQITGSLNFLAGTIVGSIFSYVFGSSFGSMAKNMLIRQKDQ